jgi:hypothetical protein
MEESLQDTSGAIFKFGNAKEFNRELIFSEVGAITCAPLTSWIVSQFANTPSTISASAVIGASVGAAIIWISTRMYHKQKRGDASLKSFASDMAYFTPVAFLLTLLIYNPVLFFASKTLLEDAHGLFTSVILSQLAAYSLFMISINCYRLILIYFGKRIL